MNYFLYINNGKPGPDLTNIDERTCRMNENLSSVDDRTSINDQKQAHQTRTNAIQQVASTSKGL